MTTKRLNFKFLAKLGIGSILFLGAVYGIHEWQVQRNADGLLRRADEARAKEDLDESARLRLRYLSHRPEDVIQYKEVALDLKTSFIDKYYRKDYTKKDRDMAVSSMSRAVQNNGTDLELRREAADFWFKFGQTHAALENLDVIQKNGEWTDEDRGMYVSCLLQQDREAEAMATISEAIGYDPATGAFDAQKATHPHILDIYRSLTALQYNKKYDRKAATATLNQMVLANPEDPKAYLLRARLFRFISRNEGLEEAQKDINKAYELAPDDIEVITAMSGIYLETNRAEDAKRLIRLGLENADTLPQKSQLYFLLSDVFIKAEDTAGAMKVLDTANREVPKDPKLLWRKAVLLLEDQEHDEVEAMYKPLKEAGQPDAMIQYLHARILLQKKDFIKATKGLRKIRNAVPAYMGPEVDNYLSAGYALLNKYDLQLEVLERMRKDLPDNERVHVSYLNALLQLRRSEEAREFATKRVADLQQAGKEIPQEYRFAIMQMQMNAMQNSSDQLTAEERAAFDEKLDQALNDESIPEAQRQALLLRKLQQNEDPAAAKKILKTAIRNAPETFLYWQYLINYADDAAEANRYLGLMRTKVDQDKYKIQMLFVPATIALKFSPDRAADELASIEGQVSSLDPARQAAVLFELGRLHLTLKDKPEAFRLFEQSLAKNPTNMSILNIFLDDAFEQSDLAKIEEITGKIRDVVGEDDEQFRIADAKRLTWLVRNQASADEKPSLMRSARNIVESIRSTRREWIPAIIVDADLKMLEGKPQAAAALLEEAHEFNRSNTAIIRQLGVLYRQLKQPAKAKRWLEMLPDSMRGTSDNALVLQTLLARVSKWTPEDKTKARQLLDSVAPETSDDVKQQLFRSRFFLTTKDYPEAEAAARRAIELDQSVPEGWVSLVSIYKAQTKTDAAMKVIGEANAKVGEDVKPIIVGRCLAVIGQIAAAQQQFATAINKSKDDDDYAVKRMLAEVLVADPDPSQRGKKVQAAANLMQDIINNADPGKHSLNIFWARRALATIYSSTMNYEAFQKSLALLEGNAVDGELSRKDLELFVKFCFSRPEKTSWDRALVRLEQIAEKRKLNDDELFMRAQLYEKYDDVHWAEVKRITTGVLARNPENTTAIQSYVLWLLKRGEVSEADAWATNNLNRNDVVRTRVNLHSDAKNGRLKRAATKIQSLAPKELDQDQALKEQLTLAALAEELGQYDPGFYRLAEQMVRKLAVAKPSEILRVATIIGKHGDTAKIQEAIKMCFDAEKAEVPLERSAQVAVAVLRQHPKAWDSSLASTVKATAGWLDRISNANPEDLGLQWRVTEFYDMVGDLERVEQGYKQILASPKFVSPNDRGMVLNNLAFAMALNGKTDEPLDLVSQAEKTLGPTSDLIDTRGFVHYVRGDMESAIKDFQTAIGSGTKTAQKLLHLALAYQKKGEKENAQKAWDEANTIGLDPYKLPPALRPEVDKLQATFGA